MLDFLIGIEFYTAAYQNFATTHENSLSKVYVNIYSHFSKQWKLFFCYLCHMPKCSDCNSVLHVCVCMCFTAYTQEDFPLQLKLRQNVNFGSESWKQRQTAFCVAWHVLCYTNTQPKRHKESSNFEKRVRFPIIHRKCVGRITVFGFALTCLVKKIRLAKAVHD